MEDTLNLKQLRIDLDDCEGSLSTHRINFCESPFSRSLRSSISCLSNRQSPRMRRSLVTSCEFEFRPGNFTSPRVVRASHEIKVPVMVKATGSSRVTASVTQLKNGRNVSSNLLLDCVPR
jgi:hypothetical protein